jgi:pyrophosphatase PpaX
MKEKRAVSCILFDMDGTLVDTISLILRSFHETFRLHGLPDLPDPELLALIGKPLYVQMAGFDPGNVDKLCDAYQAQYEKLHDGLAREFPGVKEVLSELSRRGYRLGVVTSKRRATARPGLAHFGLDRFFEVIITANDTTRHKPDPEPVLAAMEALGCSDGQTAYVGDSTYDVDCANAAGVLSVAVLWGPFSLEVLEAHSPAVLLQSPHELLELFPGPPREGG